MYIYIYMDIYVQHICKYIIYMNIYNRYIYIYINIHTDI